MFLEMLLDLQPLFRIISGVILIICSFLYLGDKDLDIFLIAFSLLGFEEIFIKMVKWKLGRGTVESFAFYLVLLIIVISILVYRRLMVSGDDTSDDLEEDK